MHSVSILRRRALFSSESPYSPGGFPFDVRLVICSDEILPAIKEADIIYDKIKKTGTGFRLLRGGKQKKSGG